MQKKFDSIHGRTFLEGNICKVVNQWLCCLDHDRQRKIRAGKYVLALKLILLSLIFRPERFIFNFRPASIHTDRIIAASIQAATDCSFCTG